MKPKSTPILFIANEIDIGDIDNGDWDNVPETAVSTYWSGAEAPAGRHFTFRMLWSAENLYVHFRANIGEPLVVSEKPDLTCKSIGLWDRDVCEIFIAPDPAQPKRYFEFEVAPTGEWLDVAIDFTGGERIADWNYHSGMETAAVVRTRSDSDGSLNIVMAMKIPFAALGKTPKPGDVWLGNLFRCVGKDPTRGYLSWSPTFAETPNFHVPAAFGEFRFV